MIIHHLKNSRSQRVLWLLEELALSYDLYIYKADKIGKAPESPKHIHPLGKLPIMVDGDIVLAETTAIFAYILERYGRGQLQPSSASSDRIYYHYWSHFADGSLMSYLSTKLVFAIMAKNGPLLARPILYLLKKAVDHQYLNPNLFAQLDFIENHLGAHAWFAGSQFSIADILIGFMLEGLAVHFIAQDRYPNIHAFIACIQSRPAYQTAQQKGQWDPVRFSIHWRMLNRS